MPMESRFTLPPRPAHLTLPARRGNKSPSSNATPREVTHGFGSATAPAGVQVYNPAFDVTPAQLIAGIITEHGIIRPVDEKAHSRDIVLDVFPKIDISRAGACQLWGSR